jgi:predicted nucleic acid-binding protein
MIYIDSSCLVKLIRLESDSAAVGRAISEEIEVIVSTLAELEALVQLKASYKAGDYSLAQLRRYEAELYLFRNREPYHFTAVPRGTWESAFRQHRNSRDIHCRTLDRLHLAAMENLNVRRLMTTDVAQANAARYLGFEVIEPGR